MTHDDELLPIENMEDLKTYLDQGYKLIGPRNEKEKDLKAIERFFNKGHVFFPEVCLQSEGCHLVEPSVLTKGLKFAFKNEGEDMFRWHRSKYMLKKDDVEFPLYLKSPEH